MKPTTFAITFSAFALITVGLSDENSRTSSASIRPDGSRQTLVKMSKEELSLWNDVVNLDSKIDIAFRGVFAHDPKLKKLGLLGQNISFSSDVPVVVFPDEIDFSYWKLSDATAFKISDKFGTEASDGPSAPEWHTSKAGRPYAIVNQESVELVKWTDESFIRLESVDYTTLEDGKPVFAFTWEVPSKVLSEREDGSLYLRDGAKTHVHTCAVFYFVTKPRD